MQIISNPSPNIKSDIESLNLDSFGNTSAQYDYDSNINHHDPKRVTINDLPTETLINIFSFLDPYTLDSLDHVCRWWNLIVNDNSAWKEAFKKRFNTKNDSFPSVTRSKLWKSEFVLRENINKKWRKGVSTFRTYQVHNGPINEVITDFKNDKLIAYSELTGDVTICSLRTGKSESVVPAVSPSETTYSCLSSKLIVFGKWDGKIFGKNLSTKSYTSALILFDSQHTGSVTCIAINEDSASKQPLDCISGSSSGEIFFWDTNSNGKLLKPFKVSQQQIIALKSDFRDTLVALDAKGVIYIIDLLRYNVTSINSSLGWNPDVDRDLFLDVDFGAKYVVISYDKIIMNVCFASNNFGSISKMVLGADVYVSSTSIQNSRANLKDQDTSIAGNDGLLYANVLSSGKVMIWNIRNNESESLSLQCSFNPHYGEKSPSIPALMAPFFPPTFSVTLSSMMCVVGGYNGFASVYDVLTGHLVKHCTARIPKKFLSITEDRGLYPVRCVSLNTDQYGTNGLISVNNVIQYFQFGEQDQLDEFMMKKNKKGGKYGGGLTPSKDKLGSLVKQELSEIHYNQYLTKERNKMFDKYNGVSFEEEEELSIILAMSENDHMNSNEAKVNGNHDDELKLALELSKLEYDSESTATANYSSFEEESSPITGTTSSSASMIANSSFSSSSKSKGKRRMSDNNQTFLRDSGVIDDFEVELDAGLRAVLELSERETRHYSSPFYSQEGESNSSNANFEAGQSVHAGDSNVFSLSKDASLEDTDQDDDFEAQLAEALRRSMLE